jgi:hypothetical protein
VFRLVVDLRSVVQLRPLRFHDLRHTFGTRMIAKADIRRVEEWMGHADIQTTMRYLHYVPREEDAQLVAGALPWRRDSQAASVPSPLARHLCGSAEPRCWSRGRGRSTIWRAGSSSSTDARPKLAFRARVP